MKDISLNQIIDKDEIHIPKETNQAKSITHSCRVNELELMLFKDKNLNRQI
jgi:hypothetical protein